MRDVATTRAADSESSQFAHPADGGICRVCDTRGDLERFRLREMLLGTREVFDYERCARCGVLQIVSEPCDMARYYPSEYRVTPAPSTQERARLSTRIRIRLARQARDFARPWPPKPKTAFGADQPVPRWARFLQGISMMPTPDGAVVDVGCGDTPGELASLHAMGYRSLLGADPFVEKETAWHGIPLVRASIHDLEGGFDLVMMHHSFEHMADPVAAMLSARRILAPDGVVLIRTPIIGTWFWRRYKTYWWELDPPRHLFVHTIESLGVCARKAGLELVDVTWDSSFEEIVASEQISRGIAWRDRASWAVSPPAGFSDTDLNNYRRQVEALNERGDAGRAALAFRVDDGTNTQALR